MIGRLLARLKRDDRGAAVIELALIAPILATLTVGIIDLSTAFSRKLVLEQAVQRAVEKIMQTTGEETVDNTIKNEAAAAAGVDVSKVSVTFTLTCNGVAQADFATECADDTTEVRYIELSISDSYTPVIPFPMTGMQSNGSYTLTAKEGIRTQ